MRRTALAMLALLLGSPAHANEEANREWRFNVSLDERPIGRHRFALRERVDSRELTSEASFRVRLLFFDAFRYEHRAREHWQGDCLQRLEARTDTNGERIEIAGEHLEGRFRLRTGGAVSELDPCVLTFAYWNPRILESRRLLNPQTGEYVSVEVKFMGRENLAGQPAERFRLTGSGRTALEIDLWYTPSRDWLALESRTPDGRRLRYTRE